MTLRPLLLASLASLLLVSTTGCTPTATTQASPPPLGALDQSTPGAPDAPSPYGVTAPVTARIPTPETVTPPTPGVVLQADGAPGADQLAGGRGDGSYELRRRTQHAALQELYRDPMYIPRLRDLVDAGYATEAATDAYWAARGFDPANAPDEHDALRAARDQEAAAGTLFDQLLASYGLTREAWREET